MFRNELTACLALTAPAGMTEEGRRDWLMVAWDSLKHLPPDLLAVGAKAARQKCDHPSKIVPTIIAETAERMRWREPIPPPSTPLLGVYRKKHIAERDRSKFCEADWAELNEYLERMESCVRYRPDGSRYMIERQA